MNKLIFLSFFAFLGITAEASEMTADEKKIAAATKALQAQAVASLGIGLRAVGLLFEASLKNMLLKDALVDSGAWRLLQQLEKKGYIMVRECNPPQCADSYVNYTLTPQGYAVVLAVEK